MYWIAHRLSTGNWRITEVPDNWTEDDGYPDSPRARIFPTEAEAQAECDKRNDGLSADEESN